MTTSYLKPLLQRVIDDKDVNRYRQIKNDRDLLNKLQSVVDIDKLKSAFERHYAIPYQPYQRNNQNLLSEFDISFLEQEKTLPYEYNEAKREWLFLISDLTDRDAQRRIINEVNKKGGSVRFAFTFEHELTAALRELKNENLVNDNDVSTSNAIEWVESVLNKGIELRASDIHIESLEDGIQVRYRVDGELINSKVYEVNDNELSNIYVRLKIIGDMDISERRRSQDGRIDGYEHMGKKYSFRVSTINTIHGEKFAMRLAPEDNEEITFRELGFTGEHERQIKDILNNSNGILYLAGATGSGKTTTLYSMIDTFDESRLNIYTIESPVERSLQGVNQIQVDEAHGNDYPSVLKALLRQDPDVLVVGEIRETETSRLAIQSSLTGHLVMTTIHANNALESITRLLDMGVESYLVGASSIGFISQRLIRTLCSCKRRVEHLPHHHEQWIKKVLPNFNYDDYKAKGNYIYEAVGCSDCVDGHKGRTAVVEIIEVDEELRALISRNESSNAMKRYLDSIGYKDMKYDGVMKALQGEFEMQELIGKLQN